MVSPRVYCPSGSHISPDRRIVTPCDPNVTQFTSCVEGRSRRGREDSGCVSAVPPLPGMQGGCQYVNMGSKSPGPMMVRRTARPARQVREGGVFHANPRTSFYFYL